MILLYNPSLLIQVLIVRLFPFAPSKLEDKASNGRGTGRLVSSQITMGVRGFGFGLMLRFTLNKVRNV